MQTQVGGSNVPVSHTPENNLLRLIKTVCLGIGPFSSTKKQKQLTSGMCELFPKPVQCKSSTSRKMSICLKPSKNHLQVMNWRQYPDISRKDKLSLFVLTRNDRKCRNESVLFCFTDSHNVKRRDLFENV